MEQQESHFIFKAYEADIRRGVARFTYELGLGDAVHEFEEVLEFVPPPDYRTSETKDPTLGAILDGLHILLGISYWKLACPRDIRVSSQNLNPKQADFWGTVYTKGLGEFYYKNSIDFRGLVQFPFTQHTTELPAVKNMRDRSLVLLGGGKDSIVSAELLKKAKKTFSLFSVNPRKLHNETAQLINAPLYEIKRTIDPKLFDMNKGPGMFNGHIPITAITSFIGLLAAYLYDFRYVVASNEESANYGNVDYLGSQVNHQWSKSFEFEKLFQDYIKDFITADISYFSLLRPMTEMHIIKVLAEYKKYFDVFSSCNRNFRITQERPREKWCGECPKCAFVFLLLAAFLPKSEVTSIFGQNLLNNDRLLSTYKELLGIEGVKPFECVGTPEEVLDALASVIEHGEYENDVIVRTLSFVIGDKLKDKKAAVDKVFTLSKIHLIPPEFADVVKHV